jgi:hypothetical protein
LKLGYLPDEVNKMEPQIAAVVIEKRLSRPLNGMPVSWEKIDVSSRKNIFQSIGSFLRSVISKMSPYVIPGAVIIYLSPTLITLITEQKDKLLEHMNVNYQRAKARAELKKQQNGQKTRLISNIKRIEAKTLSHYSNDNNYRFKNKNPIDSSTFLRVSNLNWFDKFYIWKNTFFDKF